MEILFGEVLASGRKPVVVEQPGRQNGENLSRLPLSRGEEDRVECRDQPGKVGFDGGVGSTGR